MIQTVRDQIRVLEVVSHVQAANDRSRLEGQRPRIEKLEILIGPVPSECHVVDAAAREPPNDVRPRVIHGRRVSVRVRVADRDNVHRSGNAGIAKAPAVEPMAFRVFGGNGAEDRIRDHLDAQIVGAPQKDAGNDLAAAQADDDRQQRNPDVRDRRLEVAHD